MDEEVLRKEEVYGGEGSKEAVKRKRQEMAWQCHLCAMIVCGACKKNVDAELD